MEQRNNTDFRNPRQRLCEPIGYDCTATDGVNAFKLCHTIDKMNKRLGHMEQTLREIRDKTDEAQNEYLQMERERIELLYANQIERATERSEEEERKRQEITQKQQWLPNTLFENTYNALLQIRKMFVPLPMNQPETEDEEDEQCSICLEPILSSQSAMSRTTCTHSLHLQCYNQLIMANQSQGDEVGHCPLCRAL